MLMLILLETNKKNYRGGTTQKIISIFFFLVYFLLLLLNIKRRKNIEVGLDIHCTRLCFTDTPSRRSLAKLALASALVGGYLTQFKLAR